MDPKIVRYRELIKGHLIRVAELVNGNPMPGVQVFCSFDDERNQYMLVKTGWHEHRRIRVMPLYLRIHEGKIWVEEDGTEDGIARELTRLGVPKEDIVLAFYSPDTRRHSDYAVA